MRLIRRMQNPTLTDLLDTAVLAAQTTGRHALLNKERRTEVNEALAHDVKLALDVECQAILEDVILGKFPGHAILGEEGIVKNDPDGYEWIIDPIDGTVNFAHGFHYWCVSVAVRHHGKILAGCVYAPELDELYTAHMESGALKNGKPIQVTAISDVKRATVYSGLTKDIHTSEDLAFKYFHALALNTFKVRILGSAALDICNVACGNAEAYFEPGIFLWDVAAASLIAEKAGATTTIHLRPEEAHGVRVLCTNGKIHGALDAIISSCM
ncbi:MAG: inositol monophosphatase [Kiritimatiellales bacterium]|nr:inositol monophosphatase [Kiritimatiellales bacterium]